MILTNISALLTIGSIIGVAIMAFFSLRSGTCKQTVSEQKVLIDTLTQGQKLLKDQADKDRETHIENSKAISNLQGQLDTYKELPLREWAETMKQQTLVNQATVANLNIIANSNTEILQTLRQSASIAATDRSNQNIGEQTVAHQTVMGKG